MTTKALWKDLNPPLVTSLVATSNLSGQVNASPKSWWTPVSYDPPMLVLSTRYGSDTTENIAKTGVFVLHLPQEYQAEKVLHTAKNLPYGENELNDVGLPWLWLEYKEGERKVPYLPHMPWMVCRVKATDTLLGDKPYTLWTAEVVDSGGYDPDLGVTDVLLHRSRNEFVRTEVPFTVRPY